MQNFSIVQTDANHITINCNTLSMNYLLDIYDQAGRLIKTVRLSQVNNKIALHNIKND